LPFALAGQNLIGIAKTGSGKTLAYLLPAIVHIEAQAPLEDQAGTPIALILAPVRELAVQISEEAQKLLKGSKSGNHPNGIWAACAYGGGSSNKGWQISQIKSGGHIVAATPGRLVDLVQNGDVGLNRVTYFVLDEADRMLEEGFEDQVGSIAEGIRPDRQTLFFSATWPTEVQELAERMCGSQGQSPVLVKIGQKEEGDGPTSREDIIQEVVVFDDDDWEMNDKKKQRLLYAHLWEVMSKKSHKVLVFVSRKDLADQMVSKLWNAGIAANAMHGGKTQDARLSVLDDFKRGHTKLLVTTDVMGRGLDIPDISHVVVYDMGDIEDYVHRIGRTARGPYGKGHALTFFEYDRKWPQLAQELCQVLEQSGQEVPAELCTVALSVQMGVRGTGKSKKGGNSWDSWDYSW
jgi:ATP-dependent RNA helicase DDX5/DBP2